MSEPTVYESVDSSQVTENLRLIPPMADEFIAVGGSPETVERAMEWALRHRYYLAKSVAPCAHGLYAMHLCPSGAGMGCRNLAELDHANVWVPQTDMESGRSRPFILAHNYTSRRDVSDKTFAYAQAHGLTVDVYPELDTWYGEGTLPIRLSIPHGWPLWPIERLSILLQHTHPVTWPGDVA